jgi:hypothetical protein
MKTNLGFTTWRTVALLALTAGFGFALTRTAMLVAKREPDLKTGGIDNAMEQARRLLNELRNVEWNPRDVDQALLRLPEQDFVDLPTQRVPDMPSFITDKVHRQYDELAFFSNTFVRQSAQIVPGQEAEVTVTGFFIVGWKDGRVNTVDVADVRLFPLPNQDQVWIWVFPGMDEYASGLMKMPGVAG